MILLLGASGYIGQAFQAELARRGLKFAAVSRSRINYTHFGSLLSFLRETRPDFLINAAGYTGKPNVDACETARADTLQGNTLFPQTVAQACAVAKIPWGHVSSGCIYAGAKIVSGNQTRIEKDLTRADLRTVVAAHPECIRGFTEDDPPNFSFRDGPCSFYSGTKALGEEAVGGIGQTYVWRLRIPFDEQDNPRNYLTKIQRYSKVYDNVNSLSHRSDFAKACVDLWERRAAYGVYNVTNPGFVTTRQVVGLIDKFLKPPQPFQFWQDDAEFYKNGAVAPRSNCVMDVSKLLNAGVSMRPVQEALEASLRNWHVNEPLPVTS